ncbi:MAG: hypothetical protein CFE24_11730 [Flavobacterium sp. BFFFF2]|nr:MAG: hypothetical protein CFE24_11730 [Flavobacterium sp. BFFFF2]
MQIEDAVNEAFEFAKKNEKNKNDYILFLSRTAYNPSAHNEFSSWTIDNSLQELIDRHRVDFLLYYLNQSYNFQTENSVDSKVSLTIELMIYSHLWESKHNLANFKKLADLIDSKPVDWELKIPEDSKFMFVKNNIRDVFEKYNLKIYQIFKECYRSQLRNAFAHSLYHFSLNGHYLVFENYKEPNHQIKEMSFDDWTVIFLKSTLLQNEYHNKFSREIEALEKGKEYEVTMIDANKTVSAYLSYDHEFKRFKGRLK